MSRPDDAILELSEQLQRESTSWTIVVMKSDLKNPLGYLEKLENAAAHTVRVAGMEESLRDLERVMR